MWALSRENITERSSEEVATIFNILRTKMPKLVELCKKHSIRFETVGDLWALPADIRGLLLDSMEATQGGTAMTFILAL